MLGFCSSGFLGVLRLLDALFCRGGGFSPEGCGVSIWARSSGSFGANRISGLILGSRGLGFKLRCPRNNGK